MSNLEKIQKGMRALQTLSKIIPILAIVGLVMTSVRAILVASDVLNTENQFLHFLPAAAEITKGQLIGTLLAAAAPVLRAGRRAVLHAHVGYPHFPDRRLSDL